MAQNWFDRLKSEGLLVKGKEESVYHYQGQEKQPETAVQEPKSQVRKAADISSQQQSSRVSHREYYGTGKDALMRFYKKGKSFSVSSPRNYGRKPKYKDPSTHRLPPMEAGDVGLSASA